MTSPSVRMATARDAASVLAIYAPIVERTAISFEESPPSVGEMAARIRETLAERPWLVCTSGEAVAGYAYASRFRARASYQWTVEVTVYVHEDHRGSGVGRRLYRALFACLRLQGFRTAIAGIALPNPGSVALHERLGFERIGVFPRIGYKLGRWHDVGWWRLVLAPHDPSPEPPRPFPSLLGRSELERALRGDAL